MNFGDPLRDQRLFNWLRVKFCEQLLDVTLRCGADGRKVREWIVVSEPETLKVDAGQTAEFVQQAGSCWRDHRIHRGGDDWHGEGDAAEVLGEINIRWICGVRPWGERDVIEPESGSEVVDLGGELGHH